MRTTNTLGYMFQHITALLTRQSEQILQEKLNVGYSQYKILRALQINPRMKQRDIAYNLGQTEASISRQVKLMINDGLLASRVSPLNRREHITVPTTKGEQLTEKALVVLEQYHDPTFGALTGPQREELLKMLYVIHAQICPSDHPNPTYMDVPKP